MKPTSCPYHCTKKNTNRINPERDSSAREASSASHQAKRPGRGEILWRRFENERYGRARLRCPFKTNVHRTEKYAIQQYRDESGHLRSCRIT